MSDNQKEWTPEVTTALLSTVSDGFRKAFSLGYQLARMGSLGSGGRVPHDMGDAATHISTEWEMYGEARLGSVWTALDRIREALSQSAPLASGMGSDKIDAERYRFLRDNDLGFRVVDGNAGWFRREQMARLDADLDKAMKSQSPSHPSAGQENA